MTALIKIPPLFREHLPIPEAVEVQGRTIGECLDDLIRQYPEVRSWLYGPHDLLKVLLVLNQETIWNWKTKENLDRPLKPGEELRILAIYAGG
jgi:molybdopterin converting factor small subunit